MKSKFSDSLKGVVFVVLLIQMANILYWSSQKEGYFGDELYSYQFVCQTGYPSINSDRPGCSYLNHWHSSEYYLDYFTVSKEEAFDFAGVYRSIKSDVHPPLYYLFLMGVCSFFREFSKWPVILLNLFFFAVSYLFLYKISEKFMGSWIGGLFSCLLWGFSVGTVTTAVFGRMYMQLTCMTLWFVYQHIQLVENVRRCGRIGKKKLAGIFAAAMAGVLTQYYFVIFAFFLGVCVWLFLVIGKKWKEAAVYTAVALSALLSCFAVWPVMYQQIFNGYRGAEAFENLGGDFDFSRLKDFFNILDREVFAGRLCFILLFLFICFLAAWSPHRFRTGGMLKTDRNGYVMFWFFLLIAVILDFAMIAKIAPYRTDRYIFNLYALVILEITAAGKACCGRIPKQAAIKTGCAAVMLFLTVHGYFTEGVGYLYKGTEEKLQIADSYADLPVVLLTDHNRRYVSCGAAFYFLHGQDVYPIEEEGIEELGGALKEVSASSFLLYVDRSYEDIDGQLCAIKEHVGAEYAEWKYDTETCSVFLVGK